MSKTVEANNRSFPIDQFHTSLLAWGTEHKRTFPWRATSNPFYIMIAELMLRRTQARQVIDIYSNFLKEYPDVHALATAPAEDVTRSLFSLGLSWRSPAFQQIAHLLIHQHNGEVPSSYDTLVSLPGIGDYVASAVCCFAFGQAIAIVDTNTVRVVGRLFGLTTHAESRRRKPVRSLLETLLSQEEPGAYNYALLDIAALICTPVDPNCLECPLLSYCHTGQERTQCQNG